MAVLESYDSQAFKLFTWIFFIRFENLMVTTWASKMWSFNPIPVSLLSKTARKKSRIDTFWKDVLVGVEVSKEP